MPKKIVKPGSGRNLLGEPTFLVLHSERLFGWSEDETSQGHTNEVDQKDVSRDYYERKSQEISSSSHVDAIIPYTNFIDNRPTFSHEFWQANVTESKMIRN